MGIRSPFTGLTAYTPRKTPVFSRSVDCRSMSVSLRTCARYASNSARCSLGAQLGRQRRVGRDHHERRPVQGVRPGRVDRDGLGRALDHEVDLGARRPADPVALHRQHPVRPVAFQRLRVLQQPVGVLGDLEVPLGQHPADDLGAAPLAPAVDDLLVGQHGLVLGAPVDVAALAVGQPPLVEPQEQPLVPAVVLGVAGRQPPRPVERRRVPAEGRRLRLDVLVRPVRGVRVVPDRRVLRGQPERVPPDRVQHVLPAQEPVPGHRVADRVRLGMPHVQVARWVREHVDQVKPLTRVIGGVARAERIEVLPADLPLVLNLARIVRFRLVGSLGRSHRVLTLRSVRFASPWMRVLSLLQEKNSPRTRSGRADGCCLPGDDPYPRCRAVQGPMAKTANLSGLSNTTTTLPVGRRG